MSTLIGGSAVFFAIVSVVLVLDGCGAAPRPCPQFLPVSVGSDQHRPNSYSLKALVRVRNDEENNIHKDLGSNYIIPSDLSLPASTQGNTQKPKGLKLPTSTVPSTTRLPETISLKPKKRRRLRPKESRRIITLDPNSSWALKTINDKPAREVLVTDKASIARDLKDSTESALVSVKKLQHPE